MREDFGVNLQIITSEQAHDIALNCSLPDMLGLKFYIRPDSLKILEPQEGDDVRDGSGSIFGYYEGCAFEQKCVIVQRNGKPFFWPQVEA